MLEAQALMHSMERHALLSQLNAARDDLGALCKVSEKLTAMVERKISEIERILDAMGDN